MDVNPHLDPNEIIEIAPDIMHLIKKLAVAISPLSDGGSKVTRAEAEEIQTMFADVAEKIGLALID